ncbi:MAG: hypothetical protein CVV42_12810 [Candidatus Riflebacteria bacterium HGW-Riflebacteria-2]|jgi:membrane associated rhomboid family serine protease/Zn-finger nucleic acid-binding protein|nr:MAG: hypothetical protein CVV42_12810 [Candidatus Riflebacteria bacterium HGW-Riflebacteria-2]
MNEEEGLLSRNLACVKCQCRLLTLRGFDDVVIDSCPTCHGTWYDSGELEQVLGDAFDYKALLSIVSSRLSEYICPCCKMSMRALVFKFHSGELVIDNCPVCRGFWLDGGELASVRNLVEAIREGVAPVKVGFSSARPVSSLAGTFSLDDRLLLKNSALDHYRSVDYETGAEISQIPTSSYLFAFLTALPVEVFNPVRAPALGLYAMIIVNIVLYIHTASLLPGEYLPYMREIGMVPADVLAGKLYSLLTSMFLHSHFWHLFANMYVLYVFGDNVYDLFNDHGKVKGPLLFLSFYLIVGVFSSIVHIVLTFFNPVMSALPVVGASGAVSGVMAAYWRAFPKTRIYQIIFCYPFKIPIWVYLGIWILMNVAIAFAAGSNARISWQAHIGGFIAGYFLIPHFLPFRLENLQPEDKKLSGSH